MKKFKLSKNFNFDSCLNKTLKLAQYSYKDILKTTHYNKSEMGSERENIYRRDLVRKMSALRFESGLGCVVLNKEAEEDEGNRKGRVDIKVQYSRLQEFDFNDEYYHTIECKRFGKKPDYRDYYENGILEFVNMKYSPNTDSAAMICFVEEIPENLTTIAQIIEKLNNYLENKDADTLKSIEDDFEHIYKSEHERADKTLIALTHLFFDYTGIFA